MSDFPMDPRDPEFEYAEPGRIPREGFYGTGSTTPPKDYTSVMAVVLVSLILLGGMSTVLSLLNVKLLGTTLTAQAEDPITVVEGGTLSQGLESGEPVPATEPTAPMAMGQASLTISECPQAVENVPETGGLSWQQVYEKVIGSVVSISAVDDGVAGSGSGVIMSADGYIITNAHVVEGAESISVLLTSGEILPARIVGSDGVSDLAVLFVEKKGLTPAEFGDSGALRVGDAVVAIGDPLGVELRGTMTDGIISAINRDLSVGGRTMSLIQTSAALNQGNSGGPLVNCFGQVIGINTMKIGDYAAQSGVEGLGFAIPVTTVKDVVDQLIAYGYVSGRPGLGLDGEMVSSFYQYYYRLPVGLMITSLDPDSDAAAKGLQTGDILLSAAGRQIISPSVLDEVVNACQIGDVITVEVYRAGRQYTVNLTIGEARN